MGTNAAKVAVGMGAEVTVLDINHRPAGLPGRRLHGRVRHAHQQSNTTSNEAVCNADLVIGAVLIPGGRAPKLVTACACSARCARAR